MGSVARSDPLKPPSEAEARGGGIATPGSVGPGSVPRGSADLQPVFGGARRRPALGGPLPFVVVAVVLGIIAVLVSGNRGEDPAAPGAIKPRVIEPRPIEPRAIEPRAVEPQAKAPSNPPVVATAAAPAGVDTDHPGEEARALIATMRVSGAEEDLDTVFRKAGESLKRGRIADAHLLYFFAARRGHAPAAFVLAGLYDPVRFDKDRSLLGRPDPLQALKWYRVAAEQGDGEAEARLKSLESWVDAKARAGDAEAERLRLSWR